MFHPVTTEYESMQSHADNFVDALLEDSNNYVVIYPNNDLGTESVFKAYERLKGNSRFRIFPSARFEYFLTLLKNAYFIIGNSSAGIRETPYYGIPAVNIGTRQQNRAHHKSVINTSYAKGDIKKGIKTAMTMHPEKEDIGFGTGNSAQQFLNTINSQELWALSNQKQFLDLDS
jgi:UDP-N-acetylglucosamine 2-epimerase (hydrolysing)